MKYHQATNFLFGNNLGFSEAATKGLQHVENIRQIDLPAAFKEWYSVEKATDLLAGWNADEPVEIKDLGKPKSYGLSHEPRDFTAQDLLPFLYSNPKGALWAIRLDKAADPQVMISKDYMEVEPTWELACDKFSTFIFTRVWDMFDYQYSLWANDQELNQADLAFVRQHFNEGPQTYEHPAKHNYRFMKDSQNILICDNPDQADWYLWADSEEKLFELTQTVWKCGTLAKTFEDLDIDGEVNAGTKILAKLRNTR